MLNSTNAEDILDNLTTALFFFDAELSLKYLNPAAEILLATSQRHAIGMKLDDLFPQNQAFCLRVREVVKNGYPLTESEMTMFFSGGRVLNLCCMINPIFNLAPSLLIELVRLDLRTFRDGAQSYQNTATRALLRGLAHEIKNPLGGLRGAAQLLARELSDASLQEYTQVIINEADRLQTLIDRMLGPNILPRKRAINIHEILDRVHTLVTAEVNCMIHLDYDPSIPPVIADPDQLIQAVLNLVRNSAQAIDSQGNILLRTRVQRQFTIGGRRYRLVLRVDIADDGAGIAEDLQPYIFLPMVTGRSTGAGLGLSIAQSLVNQNGGQIEYTSQPGKTIFSIFLPISS